MAILIKSTIQIGLPGPPGPAGPGASNATTSTPGAVQLAGALGGTAASPTALGFANRAALDTYIAQAIADAIAEAGGVTPTSSYVEAGYVSAGYVN